MIKFLKSWRWSILLAGMLVGLLSFVLWYLPHRDWRNVRQSCRSKVRASSDCWNLKATSEAKHDGTYTLTYRGCGKRFVAEWGQWCKDCSASCRVKQYGETEEGK